MKADEILRNWADFFKERNKDYSDGYLRFGEVLATLFPQGITLTTADDFFDFHIIMMEVVKLMRITNAMSKNEKHYDSWKDLAVYAAMYIEKEQRK